MRAPDEVALMQRLHGLGWGTRRIAAEVGCNRETVQRYLAAGEWAPCRVPTRLSLLARAETWSFRRPEGRSLPVERPAGTTSSAASWPCGRWRSRLRSLSRVEGINASHGLPDVLHAHGDVPPIQNAGGGLADRGANEARKRGFTIAKDRDGATRLPSLITKGLAQCRQRGFSAPGCESKPPRRLSRHLDLPHGDVEVSRLVAMSCPYVRPIDQDHDLVILVAMTLPLLRRSDR